MGQSVHTEGHKRTQESLDCGLAGTDTKAEPTSLFPCPVLLQQGHKCTLQVGKAEHLAP